jgi:SAM-dependent methyltransferase
MRNEQESSTPLAQGEAPSHAYWRTMSGYKYQQMMADRVHGGQISYGQQEEFLSKLLGSEQQRFGRALEVLEVGCGFGRHAWWIPELPAVHYHGYDFSEEMVAPLRKLPPAALLPLEEHLFVGPDVAALVGERRFDVIFTVSVLIHNPPDRARALLRQMQDLLAPGGTLCLIENRVVPFGLYDNNWHQGCWLHRYLDFIQGNWDLHLAQRFVETHDIYVLRANEGTGRRIYRLSSPERPLDQTEPLQESQVDLTGLPVLEAWVRNTEPVIERPENGGGEALAEARELLRVEQERVARREKLLSLAEDLQEIRAHQTKRPPVPTPSEEAPVLPSNVLIDDPFDTHWAHEDGRFHHVLHLFSQEWHGVRAAAGYLPGHKIAIAAGQPLSDVDHRTVLEAIASTRCRVLVIHAWSANLREVAQLAKKMQPGLRVAMVWHGSSAQLFLDFDFDAFDEILRLRREGFIDALGAVKPGLQVLSSWFHPQTLLNVGPSSKNGAVRRSKPEQRFGAALVPVLNIPLKNFYTNLYAAGGEPRLRTVFVTTAYRRSPEIAPGARVIALDRPTRSDLFRLTADVDVVLNATLSECQPMTAVEALAHRVPCLTGPMSLGDLDMHPYQRLVQTNQVDSVGQVRAVLARILDEAERDPIGLRSMMDDYENRLIREAFERYLEFLRP